MTKYLPILLTVVATVLSAVAAPQYIAAHPVLYAALNAVAQILHSVLPSTGPVPAASTGGVQ